MDQCQILPVTGPGQPIWNYNMIHSLWLPLLGLGVWGKDQVAHHCWPLSAPVPGACPQKSHGTPRLASAYLLVSVTERAPGGTQVT